MTLTSLIPNYNHAAELPAAVSALRAQMGDDDELLIVDDGSTDDSIAVAQQLVETPGPGVVRLIERGRNGGVASAFNAGLAEARGAWVYGAGADDTALPGFLPAVHEAARRHPEAGIIVGNVVCAYDDHRGDERIAFPGVDRPTFIEPSAYASHLHAVSAGFSLSAATVYRTDLLRAAGGFDAELGAWGDTFVARALGLRHGVVALGLDAARLRVRAGGFWEQSVRDRRRMEAIGARAAALLREGPYAGLLVEDAIARWETRWRLEMCGGYAHIEDDVLPRRLRDVRRAYATLGREGALVDRALSAVLRLGLGLIDRKRRAEDPGYRRPTTPLNEGSVRPSGATPARGGL